MTDTELFNAIEDRYLEPPEGKTIFTCEYCENDIYEGEIYYETSDGKRYCSDCVRQAEAYRE